MTCRTSGQGSDREGGRSCRLYRVKQEAPASLPPNRQFGNLGVGAEILLETASATFSNLRPYSPKNGVPKSLKSRVRAAAVLRMWLTCGTGRGGREAGGLANFFEPECGTKPG